MANPQKDPVVSNSAAVGALHRHVPEHRVAQLHLFRALRQVVLSCLDHKRHTRPRRGEVPAGRHASGAADPDAVGYGPAAASTVSGGGLDCDTNLLKSRCTTMQAYLNDPKVKNRLMRL